MNFAINLYLILYSDRYAEISLKDSTGAFVSLNPTMPINTQR